MANNDNFMLKLIAALDVAKSKVQVNRDIKELEKVVNKLRLTATLYKGDSKKQIDSVIHEIEGKVKTIKLKAKFDKIEAQKAVSDALSNVTLRDIKINEHGLKLKVQKAFHDIQSDFSKTSIPINLTIKKENLQNQLTAYLTKNSKIKESSILLKESDMIRKLFDSANDKESLDFAIARFKLFKSEVSATGFATKSTTDKIAALIGSITKVGSLFGVASFGIQKYKQSLQTLKEMSTLLTEISKTSNIAGEDLKHLGDSSFQIASKYGKSSSSYLEGVREMARSGYDGLAKELGELSVLAQSAGDMTAENANNYLLASDAAYKYSGNIEKLTAALDGANFISNNNSVTLTDLADATRVSASYAAQADVGIDELTASVGTMSAVTKRSGSEMGRAFRSILLNLQQVSGEFDGEIIDEESLKKVEDRCHSLGIELETITAEGAELRNPMEVLKELADVYNSLPDNSVEKQGIISDIGGKYHANALSALLSRWDLYEKMLSEFSQGTGSAFAEAMKTADSWEGRLQSLENTYTSFVNSLTNQNQIKSGISFLDGAIQGFEHLTEIIGAIPMVLTTVNTALSAMNKDYGITQIVNPETNKLDLQGKFMGVDISGFKSMRKHLEGAEVAISKWNDKVLEGAVDINDFTNATVKNSIQLKEYLSTCTNGSATLEGYKAYLREAGVETDTLRLKTVLMTTAMSFLVSMGIQGALMAFSKLGQVIHDQIHAVENAKEVLNDSRTNFDSVKLELENINKELETNKKRIEELNALPSLTYVEQGELEKLQAVTKELERQKDIKDIETKRAAENLSEANQNAFNKEFKDNHFSYNDVKKLESEYGDLPSSPVADVELASQGLEGLAAALMKVQKAKAAAESTNNQEWMDSLIEREQNYRGQLEDNLAELQKYRDNLNTLMDYRELTIEEKAFYDNLEQGMKLVYQFTNPSAWNQIEFDNIFNTTSLDVTKEKLIELSKAGKLDEETIKQFSALNEAINQTDFILDDGKSAMESFIEQINALARDSKDSAKVLDRSFTKPQMINAINGLSEGFDSLDKIMASIKDENPFDFALLDDTKFKDTFSELDDAYTDFIEQISNTPDDIEACQSAFDNLATVWIDSTGILQQVDESNAALTASMLELMGLGNAEEIVYDALNQKLAEAAYQKYQTANAGFDLANAEQSEVEAFFNSAEAAGVSRAALFELQLAKITANNTTVVTDGDIQNLMALANAASIASAEVANAKLAMGQKNKGGVARSAGAEHAISSSMANNLVEGMRRDFYTPKINYSGGNKTNSGGGGGRGGSGGGGAKPATKEIDWIDRELELLDKKRQELEKKASSTYIDYLGISEEQFNRAKEIFSSQTTPTEEQFAELSQIAQAAGLSIGDFYKQLEGGNWTASKQGYLSQSLEVGKTELERYTQAVEKYQKEYEDALGKIDPSYRSKIENGGPEIEVLQGDNATNVQEAIDAYDKLTAVKAKQSEAQDKQIAKTKEYYDLIDESIENEEKALADSNSLIEKQIDYLNAAGQVISSDLYDNLIRNTDGQIEFVERRIANKKAELNKLLTMPGGISIESKDYVELKKAIAESELALYGLKKTQEEYNFQLLQLPIQRLGMLVSMYQDIGSEIENWGAQMEASGKKLNAEYYQSMIDNGNSLIGQLQEEAGLIEDAMDEVDEGSDNWLTLYKQLQDVNGSISTTVQQMHRMNEELLKMPFANISELSSDLQTVVNGLTAVKSEYDTVLSAVTGAIQAEMDALQAENTLTNEIYEKKISGLQEQLDLLEKVNEEKNLQYNLEKAQIELEKARNQKVNKVLRNGVWDWDENIDSVNDASKKVEDAQFEIDKSKLQDQIDGLNDELDGINEKYQKQTEELQKQSDKWSEIVEKIEQAQNELKANDLLGDSWKDKVMTGNDMDIFNMFQGLYQTNSDQIAKYEQQLTTTENISNLLQEYINAYKEGSITYEQAQAGISDILSQMNNKMSAMDNLQNIFDFMGTLNDTAANADAVLNGITTSLSEAANSLTESLKQYDKNADMLSKYQSSWEQLTDNVSKMLDVMEEVRDNLENGYREEEDDEEEDDRKDSSSSSSGGGSKPSGPASDPDYTNRKPNQATGPAADPDLTSRVKSHHKGIFAGMVGNGELPSPAKFLQSMVKQPIKQDETMKILKNNEFVFTNEQVENLVKNFQSKISLENYTPKIQEYIVNMKTPNISSISSDTFSRNQQPQQPPTTNFNFGDVNITEARNASDVAEGLMTGVLEQTYAKQLRRNGSFTV